MKVVEILFCHSGCPQKLQPSLFPSSPYVSSFVRRGAPLPWYRPPKASANFLLLRDRFVQLKQLDGRNPAGTAFPNIFPYLTHCDLQLYRNVTNCHLEHLKTGCLNFGLRHCYYFSISSLKQHPQLTGGTFVKQSKIKVSGTEIIDILLCVVAVRSQFCM